MLNKVSENCYLFILSYGHLDLLITSMYCIVIKIQQKKICIKPTWNLVKILITGTIFFYFTLYWWASNSCQHVHFTWSNTITCVHLFYTKKKTMLHGQFCIDLKLTLRITCSQTFNLLLCFCHLNLRLVITVLVKIYM